LIATSERDCGQEHHEEHKGEWAGGKRQEREACEERAAAELQKPESDESERASKHERVGRRDDE
jgi:hypothetical protein